MKLLRTTKTRLVFHLEKREKRVLIEVLKLYPRIPPSHLLSVKASGPAAPDASRGLLEDALAEQRSENKKQVHAWLNDPGRFEETEHGCRLSLSHSQLEWLLQILNDVRIGSWVILGSPEPARELSMINETTAPHFWAMDAAGLFQMHLLEAMEGTA